MDRTTVGIERRGQDVHRTTTSTADGAALRSLSTPSGQGTQRYGARCVARKRSTLGSRHSTGPGIDLEWTGGQSARGGRAGKSLRPTPRTLAAVAGSRTDWT